MAAVYAAARGTGSVAAEADTPSAERVEADTPSAERVSTQRHLPHYFHTYDAATAGTATLVEALRARLDRRINGSVLANLNERGEVFISFSEKDRSASSDFWREVCGPLKQFLAGAPALARRDLPATMTAGDSCMFQVQWLTGRKANYWHQDVRWKQHWDAVFFLYAGNAPTPTDLACPAVQPATCATPKEYVKCAEGQPDIAAAARSGAAVTYRPRVARGDVVCVDNKRTWHRTPEILTLRDDAAADDALMTVRLKHFPPRPARP